MQYRYGSFSIATSQFAAIKAGLRHVDVLRRTKNRQDGTNKIDYAGNFTGFAGQAWRRSKNGTHVRIAVVPQYPRTPGIAISQPVPGDGAQEQVQAGSAPVPPHFTSPPQSPPAEHPPSSTASGCQKTRGAARPFPSASPPTDPPATGTCGGDEDNDFQRQAPSISTSLLSGLLSITAAIAVGMVIANNNAFKLKVGEADSTDASPPSISAPPALARSRPGPVPGQAPDVPEQPPNTLARSSAAPRQPPKPNRGATARDTTPARIATVTKPKQKPKVKSSLPPSTVLAQKPAAPKSRRANSAHSALDVSRAEPRTTPAEVQKASPSSARTAHTTARPGTGYASCLKLQGWLRRERCKWEVCNGKWGKQGCPSYQYNNRPEPGYGQVQQAEAASVAFTQ